VTGEAIRRAREAKRWTQTDLAHAADTTQAYVSDLENGKRENIEVATLRRIAAALGKEILITLVEPVATPTAA